MAHEITETDSMYSANRIVPWHGLGKVVDEAPTAADAIELAGLGWEVDLQPITIPGYQPTEETPVFPGLNTHRAVVRSDTQEALTVVNETYEPIQNRELFSFADTLLDTGDIRFETAGSLKGGRWVWALARLSEDVNVYGDEYRSYLMMASSHDQTLALTAQPTNVRVVCANTCQAALKSRDKAVKVRHTKNARKRIAEARRTLAITYKNMEQFEEQMKRLVDTEFTDVKFERLVNDLQPHDDDLADAWVTAREIERDRLFGFWNSDTVGKFRGTAYGAYQAVNEWELWAKARRGDTEQQAVNLLNGKAIKKSSAVLKNLVDGEARPGLIKV